MKTSLHITATLDQPVFLEDLVEKLADRRYDIGYSRELMPEGFEALDTSSTETYVGGVNAIEDQGEQFNMPFITKFLFTCVKGKNSGYKLGWSSSLS